MPKQKTVNQYPTLVFSQRGRALYYAVSYLGQRSNYISTGVRLEKGERWNKVARRVQGNELKSVIIQKKDAAFWDVYSKISLTNKPVTAQMLMDYFTEKRQWANDVPTVLGVADKLIAFERQRLESKTLKPKEFSRLTPFRRNVSEFLLKQFGTDNVAIEELKPIIGQQYEAFLTAKHYAVRTVNKNLWFFGRVLDFAVNNEWATRNVLKGHKKPTAPKVKKQYLTIEEIQTLYRLEIQDSRLSDIRWQFLFLCFTGMNHKDLKVLKKSELQTDQNGLLCIVRQREKSKEHTVIPSSKMAIEIIDKCTHKDQDTGLLFDTISLDKTNKYLAAIQALSNIRRVKLSTGLGRKTYSTLLINLGVSPQMIMVATGHSKLETLMNHYATVQTQNSSLAIHNALQSIENQFINL